MKRKKVIIIGIVLLLVIIGILALEWRQKENRKQLTSDTENNYTFYKNGQIQENSIDETSQFLNTILKEKKKNDQINFDTFLQNLLKNGKLEETEIKTLCKIIDDEIQNYNGQVLETLNQKKLLDTIQKKEVDQDTLIAIFESNPFIKNLPEEKNKRLSYVQKLEELKKRLEDLNPVWENVSKEGEQYWVTTKEDFSKLQNFSETYHLNLLINQKITPVISKEVPILCYHGILDEPWGISSLFVRVQDFERQMQYLKEQGYTTLFVSEIKNANQYEKPIIITFDDGYLDVYTNAFPILKKYNLKANVYMISGWINGDVYMTSEMTKEMSASPLIEIGSHTVTHKALATLSTEEIEYELRESKKALEELLEKKINVVAYPTGSYNQTVIDIARQYYQYGISTVNGKENPNQLHTYDLRRIYVYRSYTLDEFKQLF